MITTSALPRLPRRSRFAFRVGLVAMLVLIVTLVLLRWQPPLVGICALGLPLLFVLYLAETDAFNEISARTMLFTVILGSGLGVGWAVSVDIIWKYTYDDVLATPMTAAETVTNLVLIPVVGVALLLLPVVVVRLWRPGRRGAMDGFTIGALGALCFTAAGILTRGAPVFANGLVDRDIPIDALFTLAAVRGIATPVMAAATGGLIGAALWFRPRADSGVLRRGPWLVALASAAAVLLLLGQNAIDFAWLSYGEIAGLYAGIALLALLALRIVVRYTVLAEDAESTRSGGSVPCPQCDRVIPEPAFCVSCERSSNGAVLHTSLRRLLLMLGGATAVVVVVAVALSAWLTPAPANYTCPPDCGRPPIGEPVTVNPRFTSADGAFSVSYPGETSAYTSTFDPHGVSLDLHAGDGGSLRLFGEPASGRTSRQIAEDLIAGAYPDAATAYDIPNAMVGYQPGYGVVADVFRVGSAGDDARLRVLVMVAVKNGLALVAAAAGPYREYSPEFGSGHPSGVNFFLALDMGKYVNSFSWRGDPVR